MKRMTLLAILFMVVFSNSCLAAENFKQYYADDRWSKIGTYITQVRITKHITVDGNSKYWLQIFDGFRNNGFSTELQVVIGSKTYTLSCVDVFSKEYRRSMPAESRETFAQEFYDIDPNLIKEIASTSEPVFIISNYLDRPNEQLKVKGKFIQDIRDLLNKQ